MMHPHRVFSTCNITPEKNYHCLFSIICMLAGITQVTGFEKPCDISTSTLQIVDQCPTDPEAYKEAAIKKNCTSVRNTCESFVYHCVMNAWRNSTVEVCAPWLLVIGQVCGEYSEYFMSIRSSERSCRNFTEPCPFSYNSTEQYKYPGCYYIANIDNTSVHIPTTGPSQSYSKSTTIWTESSSQTMPIINDVQLKNIQGLTAEEKSGIVIAVLVVLFICLLIVFFAYVRRKMINEQKSCKQVIAAIPFCCQCLYEGSIMLKIQIFMDKRYRRVDVPDPPSQSTLVVTPDATSSVPLLSNTKNDEDIEITGSPETYTKQIVENDDECDFSVNTNIQQKPSLLQNQPDAPPTTTRTTRALELKSAVHPSNERVTPPSSSEAQKIDSYSASPLDLSFHPDQQSEAGLSVSSHIQDKYLNSPQVPQILKVQKNTTQTEHLGPPFSTSDSGSNPVSQQNSPSSHALDQPQDISSITLQNEPLDLSISSAENQRSPSFYLDKSPPNSSVNLSVDCTPVSISTNLLDNSQIFSTSRHAEVSPVTSSPLSSNDFGSGDSDTTQKKVVKSVSPESPEASSELAPTGPPPPQHKIKLGNTYTTAETSQNTPKSKLSTSKRAEGRGFSDRMHGDNTEEKIYGNAANNRDVPELPMEVNELDLENISGASPIPDSDELKENSTRNEAMECILYTVVNELKSVKASMSQLQLSLTDALSELKSTREELIAAKKELLVAEKNLETATEELRQTRDQLQAQDQRMFKKDKEIEDLRVKICEKDRLLCEKDRKIKAQQQELFDKDRTINDKDRIINEKQRQNIEKEAELDEKEREVRKREEELKAQRDRIRQLEDQKHEKERKVESLESELRRRKSHTQSESD